MKKRVPLIKQHEGKDCGAACLSIILAHYGKKIPFAAVSESIKVDQYGANIYGLLDGAKQFDLIGTALEGSADEFIAEVRSKKIQLPVIARIVNRFNFEHYIVVTSIRGNNVHYCDPGEGRKKISCEHFAKCFLGQIVSFAKTENFTKENRRKGSMMEFIRLITRQKGLVAVVGILSVLVTAVGMMGTFLFQYLIDTVLPELSVGHAHSHEGLDGIEVFAVLILSVGILYLVRFLIQVLRGKLIMFMQKRINLPLMMGYYDHVVDLKMDFFSNHKTGDLISRFSDAGKVQDGLSRVALSLMIDVPMVLFCGITLYRQSQTLFLIVLSILVLYIITSVLYIKPLEKKNRQLMVENSQLNSYLKETIDGIQTVKAFSAGNTVKARTKELFQNLQNSGMKIGMLSVSKDALIELMTSVGTLCLLWVGAISIASGEMTLGILMTFHTLLGYFLSPIQNIIELQSTLQSAMVAASRLRDILDRSKENNTCSVDQVSFKNGAITFENVDFRYGNRSLILKDLNLEIQQGDHVALVGSSGCGKTTITKLLMNFYKPEKGSIRIGGAELGKMDVTTLRERVAYVPQETFLFSDTVRNNLTLGNDATLDDTHIERILDVCGCDFVRELPFGLDTMLEENGNNLSGGQRQRLAVARALLRNPEILILDEATSALDTISERKLQDSLRQFNQSMTVIMVAHRLNSIRGCNRILVLDQGTLAEEGSHTQLMDQGGLYASMYNSMN